MLRLWATAGGIPTICEAQQVLPLLSSPAYSFRAILSETSGASGGMSSLGIAAEGLVIAIVFLTVGLLAFSGMWRWWARVKPPVVSIYYFPYLPLGIGWMGVGLAVMAPGLFLPPAIEMPVIYLGVAISFFGLIGSAFMPRALLPRWYRAAKGLDRRAADASRGATFSRDLPKGRAGDERACPGAESPTGTRDGVAMEEVMRKAFGSSD